jgi:class 3 adenylate cyclase
MRVVRTFAFLDLCGFTTHTEEHGDAAAVAVLARLRALLRAEAEGHGVRVTKWLGDGAMLSGIDRNAVLDCTSRVRDQIRAEGTLALRAGIAGGPVIMFEGDDYIGASVNLAARLCGAAAPGQILVASTGSSPAHPHLSMLPPIELPGLPALVEAYELTPAGRQLGESGAALTARSSPR